MNAPIPYAAQRPIHEDEKFIDKIQRKIEENQPFFSFEYFPPRTADGLNNLYERIKRMNDLGSVCFH